MLILDLSFTAIVYSMYQIQINILQIYEVYWWTSTLLTKDQEQLRIKIYYKNPAFFKLLLE